MAYRFHIDTSSNCVFVQHYDEIIDGEMTRQTQELLAHPLFVPSMNLLRDLTTTNMPEHYDLKWFVDNYRSKLAPLEQSLGHHRMVAWVLGNAKDFKTIHQFCATTRLNQNVVDRQPFRDVSRAMKWLGLPERYEISYSDLDE